jgi:iron complex transport system ATP-binding protein
VLLQATDLRFGYGRARAAAPRPGHAVTGPGPVIDGLSVDVPEGAIVGILGPNGSGKTTLLKLLAGTLTPQAGSVRLDGRVLSDIPHRELARRVAVVPQETQLAFDYTVLDIALMGRYPWLGAFEVEGPADLAAAMSALRLTGTAEFAARAFPTLSGGEKQRVVVASALAQLDTRTNSSGTRRGSGAGRQVLFLDEPTASLDLRYQLEIERVIARLHDERGVTIVLSTHDLRFAAAVCSSVLLLSQGRVLAQGAAREVLTPDLVGTLYEIPPSVAAPLLA